MSLTRFFDRQSGRDGPVSGALQILPVGFTLAATNGESHQQVKMPAGMAFYILDVSVYSGTVTGSPTIQVGTTAGGTQIAAPVNLSTALGALTLKSQAVSSGDRLDVRVTAAATQSAEDVSVSISGYVSAPPDSEAWRP